MTGTAVCVLGMHRSGTSILTRALSIAGVCLGDDAALMPGQPDNPDGYFERAELVSWNERLLAVFDRAWDDAEPLPDDWLQHPEVLRLLPELSRLLDGAYPGESLWGFKDPRTCLVLPAWRRVLADRNERLVALMPVRDPFDVARSLEKRDGYPIGRSLVLWLHNVSSALAAAEGIPVAIVSYGRFQDDPAGQLRAAFRLLELPQPPDAVDAGLRAVVRPRPAPTAPAGVAPHAVRALHELLERPEPRLAGSAELAAARAARAELEAYGAAFGNAPAQRRASARIEATERRAAEAIGRAEAAAHDVATRAETAMRHAEARAREAEAELGRVTTSRSWKLTAPVRAAARHARKLTGRE